jgi:hypothetical protein
MIDFRTHNQIARQRHEKLLADAERYRLARVARDRNINAPEQRLRGANLAVKFLLELAAFAAFAYWGTTVADGVVGVLTAIAAATTSIALWGLFAAPRSQRRLPLSSRVSFELAVFALATLALLDTHQTTPAVILATLAVGNSTLLTLRPE